MEQMDLELQKNGSKLPQKAKSIEEFEQAVGLAQV